MKVQGVQTDIWLYSLVVSIILPSVGKREREREGESERDRQIDR